MIRSTLLLFLLVLLMSGCEVLPVKEPPAEPVDAAPVQKVVSTPPPARPSIEERLLMRAEKAFREGRLLPARSGQSQVNNAYDQFHSVLLINAGNTRAQSGLQAILLNYSSQVRRALSINRFDLAKKSLAAVELYYPANALLMDLKGMIREQEEASRRQDEANVKVNNLPASVPEKLEFEDITLEKSALSQKDAKTVKLLEEIALRLKRTDESIMIFARNDSEGRWIYKQMKNAVKGYRVRGDIRYSKSPKIRILPPL